MKNVSFRASQSGVTLVELVVSIVVIAVGVAGVLLAIQFTTGHSADPMIRQQAVAIADSYMEEILLQPYSDPDGTDSGETRSTFDDVFDYDGLSQEPTDQTGNPMPGLQSYQVTVEVRDDTLGPSGDKVDAAEITVSVAHDTDDVQFALTGHKTTY